MKNDFSKGSIGKHMLKLAIPMTLAQLVNILYNIIDRIFIGKIPIDSTNALTGVGVAFPICTVTIALANLVGMGGAPLFSIERGAGNEDEAKKILGNSFSLLLIIGVLYTILGFVVKGPVLNLLGASSATYHYADSYISMYLCGSLFVMLSLGLNAFINSQGFAKTAMMTVSIGAICNIILDPILIYACNMGVTGAALATVISQFVAAMWTIHFLRGERTLVRIEKKAMALSKERVKRIFGLGMAGFTRSITNSAVQMACNANLAMYGGDIYIGAMTVINSIREVVEMPINGIANGGQPVMSFNYGAKKPDRVKKVIKYMSVTMLIYTFAIWQILLLFSHQAIGIFNSNEELITTCAAAMQIYFFGFFMMTFQFAGQSAFTALGMSKKAVFFSIFRKVIIVVPLIFLLPMIPGLGVNGVFLAEPISNFIGGIACFTTMYISVYRKL